MRWLVAEYQPVGLFSLKHGDATSTGAKSLLVPTPFSIRTALLDVAIRVHGQDRGPDLFEVIRELRLAMKPPSRIAVTGLFGKVIKPERDRTRGRAVQETIAFREYVQLQGSLQLAFGGESTGLDEVAPLLPHVSYFGKRGSFFQFLTPPLLRETRGEEPPEGFVSLEGPIFRDGELVGGPPQAFAPGIMQRMDDWGPELTYARVNSFSGERIRLHRDRVRYEVILPYRIARAGRGFTVYEGIS